MSFVHPYNKNQQDALFNFNLILPKAIQHKGMTYTNCCIYRVVPPDNGFGGLVVSMLASDSRVRGFDPSFGGEVK
jgi:hypothetical protein